MGEARVLRRGTLTPFLLVVILGACSTNPGRTTAIGAGTGAALGAGLGAIVGAGAGDSGTGIALGTVAGTAAGTFVGNSIEGQDKEIASQGEVIRTQDQALMSQRAELERLRTQLGDAGSYSNTGPFPPAEQPWGQNSGSEFGASERSKSFKGHSHDPYGAAAEGMGAAGVRSRADFGNGEPGRFEEDSFGNGSSDGHVFISKSKKATAIKSEIEGKPEAGGEAAFAASGSSAIQFTRGKGDLKLSSSHPANRFAKYRDPKGEESSPAISRSQTESKEVSALSKGEPAHYVSSKGDASRVNPEHRVAPMSDSSSHPKRGRGAIEEKSLPAPVVDNVQGEDEKVLSASSASRRKVPQAVTSDLGSNKSGSVFEELDKSENSKSEGALTAGKGRDCQDATKELAWAGERALPADKLFHLRRALRLCPEDPRYHLELAALYRSLGRDGDAIYEYHEVARIDPDNQEASKALKELGSSAG
jgi:hypothetical protein